jgi:hypothetical protein
MEEDGGRRELISPLLEAASCSTRKPSTWPSCAAGFLCHTLPRPLILCGGRPIPQRRRTREKEMHRRPPRKVDGAEVARWEGKQRRAKRRGGR